jgi:hypothetical protein
LQSLGSRQTAPAVAPTALLQANCGHWALLVQACATLMLQCPPMMAQSLTEAHRLPKLLQWPTGTQFGSAGNCPMQLLPVTLQTPGCGTQTAAAFAAVQLVPNWILQWPGSGVHVGFEVGTHGFSGSGGSLSQPGGL